MDNSSEDFIPEKVAKAEKRINNKPYDTEAWSILIRDAQTKKQEDARKVYERLVTMFPTTGKYWKIYIEHEMKNRNYERVEKLFQRCLIKVLNIDLWKTYLGYIRETKGALPSFREKMAQAYDFALDKIGMDVFSYQIWVDYVAFLKGVEAVGSYAENQRITAVRKVYHKGVTNPMMNIEAFWKEYCSFETSINPLIAKKMQEDKVRDYTNCKRVAKEYEGVTKGLNRNQPSVPPTNAPEEIKQVELWKKYIQWEKENPLRTEDRAGMAKRVMFAYEQALLCLGHHPDIWIEAAAFLQETSKVLTEKGDQNAGKTFADEAAAIYERAISSVLKNNTLIYFAYADFEEGRMKHEKVHQIYKRIVAVKDIDPTLAYVQYMRFARRAEGIKAARIVFKLAREDNRTKYHVYQIAALMEYYCTKDKTIALKIFELGLKKFGEHPDYILSYLEYMSHINEDNNTRVLFERVLSGQLPNDKSHEVWNRFLDFESTVGDLASILKVEKRRAQCLGDEFQGKDTALLIDRYKYHDLLPCSSDELRALGYRMKLPHDILHVEGKILHSDLDDPSFKPIPKYPMPATEQMLPFKPKIIVPKGAHPVDGGVFAPPLAACDLMVRLPPPDCFQGPFVAINKMINHLKDLKLPDHAIIENGVDPKNVDIGTQLSIDIALGRKRKAAEKEEGSDEEDNAAAPPAHDIYRQRQQKKVK